MTQSIPSIPRDYARKDRRALPYFTRPGPFAVLIGRTLFWGMLVLSLHELVRLAVGT